MGFPNLDRRALHPAGLAALLIAALLVFALTSLLARADIVRLDAIANAYVARLLWSSAAQALLSTILSLALGAAVALACERLRSAFAARLLRALLLTAAVAPTIVIVLGVVSIYGRSGWFASLAPDAAWPSIYGLPGILIAHVALNAPYAARVFQSGLRQAPAEHHRIAALHGFSAWRVFVLCDWPAIRRDLPGLAAFVALVCFTSFATVLTLGGGPRWATLEVAIYEALRVDVDFGRAALLSLVQLAVTAVLVTLASRVVMRGGAPATIGGRAVRADADSIGLRLWDAAIVALYLVFLAPVALASLTGFARVATLADADVARAFATSLAIAAPASCLCVALALILATGTQTPLRRLTTLAPMATHAVPPFALVAGLYVPLRGFGEGPLLAGAMVALVNALVALPFAFRLIEPALRLSRERYGRLCAGLGLRGLDRLRVVDGPMLRGPLLAALMMALALSFGDFGVAALFGGAEFRTLPLLLHERMGAYRMEEAEAVALLLLAVAFLLALILERFADAPDR